MPCAREPGDERRRRRIRGSCSSTELTAFYVADDRQWKQSETSINESWIKSKEVGIEWQGSDETRDAKLENYEEGRQCQVITQHVARVPNIDLFSVEPTMEAYLVRNFPQKDGNMQGFRTFGRYGERKYHQWRDNGMASLQRCSL